MAATIITSLFLVGVALGVSGDLTACPEIEGLQVYPQDTSCDLFYKCANGTLTLETCPNGLLFGGDHCRYDWEVDCGHRKDRAPPISTANCPWLNGIFPITPSCNPQFFKCLEGEPYVNDCEIGLAYDHRIHACNWPDLLGDCDENAIAGFTCPEKVTGFPARFLPHPRYPYPPDCTRYVTCINAKHPHVTGCGHNMGFNPETLTCENLKYLPGC